MPETTDSPNMTIHPFKIKHIFFTKISVGRKDELPDSGSELLVTAEVAASVLDSNGLLHVNLRVRNPEAEDPCLSIEIEASSVSEYVGEDTPTDEEYNNFVNDYLLVAMFSRVIQLLALLSGQMGMPPVWLPNPRGFGFDISLVRELSNDSSSE